MSKSLAVIGSGAIGGLIAYKLAKAGLDVTCIARETSASIIKKKGLRLHDGETLSEPLFIPCCTLSEAARYDYVLLALKNHQVYALADQIAQLCNAHTSVVTLQNGIPWWYFYGHTSTPSLRLKTLDFNDKICSSINPNRVIGCVVYPASTSSEAGLIHWLNGNKFTLGEPTGESTERCQILADYFQSAGFRSPISRDIRHDIWIKLLGNLSFNPVAMLTHASLAQMVNTPLCKELIHNLMREIQTIGEKTGIQFRIALEKRIQGAGDMGSHKPSTLQDIEQGKPTEIKALLEPILELAQIYQLSTPHLQTVFTLSSLLEHNVLRSGHGLKLIQNENFPYLS